MDKGSNWIPADNFLTTITDDRYRAWLTLLRDGNQNMVRLWGGGVYEPDIFYDICDGRFAANSIYMPGLMSFFHRAWYPGVARFSICMRSLPSTPRVRL